MKKTILLTATLLFAAACLFAQSETTQALQKEYGDMFSLYFYKNTLRMLNQKEDKDFDDLIRNVEKMKLLMVNKTEKNFGENEYKKLTSRYKAEFYDPIVTSRFDGRNFDIFLNDKKGSTPGTVVLVNDSTSLYILDIIGTFDVSKAGALFSVIDGSQDFGKMLKAFDKGDDRKGKKKGID